MEPGDLAVLASQKTAEHLNHGVRQGKHLINKK
jgi:hypothetical protein